MLQAAGSDHPRLCIAGRHHAPVRNLHLCKHVTVAIQGGGGSSCSCGISVHFRPLHFPNGATLHGFAPDPCAVFISHLIEPLQRPQSSQTSADALAATIESKPSYTEARPELKGLLYEQVSLISMQAAGS